MTKAILEHTDRTLYTHPDFLCDGEHCVVHNRSDHPYRHLPQLWWDNSMWRLNAEERWMVLDPDEIATDDDYAEELSATEIILRNSAHCNVCNTEIESTHRHDFVACKCPDGHSIFVDGGRSYLRRGFNHNTDWHDTSIVLENVQIRKGSAA